MIPIEPMMFPAAHPIHHHPILPMKVSSLPFCLPLFALASLPAHAQNPPPLPPSSVAPSPTAIAPPASRKLPKVRIEAMSIGEMIEFINQAAESAKAPQVNVVADESIKGMPLPNITLQNVTTTDVLQIASEVAHLRLNVIPSDDGTVAAYILEREQPSVVAGKMSLRLGGLGGSEGGAAAPAHDLLTHPKEAPPAPPTSGFGGNMLSGGSGGLGGIAGQDPAASGVTGSMGWSHSYAEPLTPAKVTRVLGIAELTRDIADRNERNDKESEITKQLKIMSKEHSLKTELPECDLQFYGGMHLLVALGHPDSVAFIEQAVAALKENVSKSVTAAPAQTSEKPTGH